MTQCFEFGLAASCLGSRVIGSLSYFFFLCQQVFRFRRLSLRWVDLSPSKSRAAEEEKNSVLAILAVVLFSLRVRCWFRFSFDAVGLAFGGSCCIACVAPSCLVWSAGICTKKGRFRCSQE